MIVKWSRLAIGDLESARAFIAENGPDSAKRTIEKIEHAVSTILAHPQVGRRGRVSGTREFFIPGTPFLIAYRLRPKKIEILSVIHGARIWPDQFDE